MPPASRELLIRFGQTRVLRHLPGQSLVALIASSRQVRTPKGGSIFAARGPAAVHVLLTGRAVLLGFGSPGTEVELSRVHPGELLGELSLFHDAQPEAARALGPVVAQVIRADDLRSALHAHPAATWDLAALIAERQARTEVRLVELSSSHVRERLACLFERLARASSIGDSRGRIITERLSHEELARLVGASRVSVTRALAAMRRSGEVIAEGRRMILTALHTAAVNTQTRAPAAQ